MNGHECVRWDGVFIYQKCFFLNWVKISPMNNMNILLNLLFMETFMVLGKY